MRPAIGFILFLLQDQDLGLLAQRISTLQVWVVRDSLGRGSESGLYRVVRVQQVRFVANELCSLGFESLATALRGRRDASKTNCSLERRSIDATDIGVCASK